MSASIRWYRLLSLRPVFLHLIGIAPPTPDNPASTVARTDVTLMWLKAHARYDDAHPYEALEILKRNVDETTDQPNKVEAAARTSLELFAQAIEACCTD